MKKKETKNDKEQRLNELFADIYSEQEAYDSFKYLTNENRTKYTTKGGLWGAIQNHMLGSLLRRIAPSEFEMLD